MTQGAAVVGLFLGWCGIAAAQSAAAVAPESSLATRREAAQPWAAPAAPRFTETEPQVTPAEPRPIETEPQTVPAEPRAGTEPQAIATPSPGTPAEPRREPAIAPAPPAGEPAVPAQLPLRLRPIQFLFWGGFGTSVERQVSHTYSEGGWRTEKGEDSSSTIDFGVDVLLTVGPVAAGGTLGNSGELFGYSSNYRGFLAGARLEPLTRLQISVLAETGWHEIAGVGADLFSHGSSQPQTIRYSGGRLTVTGIAGGSGWLLLGGIVAVRVDHEKRNVTVSGGGETFGYEVGGTSMMLALAIGIRP